MTQHTKVQVSSINAADDKSPFSTALNVQIQ